jgi:hypothetical protein
LWTTSLAIIFTTKSHNILQLFQVFNIRALRKHGIEDFLICANEAL